MGFRFPRPEPVNSSPHKDCMSHLIKRVLGKVTISVRGDACQLLAHLWAEMLTIRRQVIMEKRTSGSESVLQITVDRDCTSLAFDLAFCVRFFRVFRLYDTTLVPPITASNDVSP